MVLEDQYITYPLITFQISQSGHVRANDIGDLVDFKFVKAAVVARCFGNDLVCAHAIHEIVKTFGSSSELAFDPKPRRDVRDDANGPARAIRG